MREGYESQREESNIMFFFRPPRKTKCLFFLTAPQKMENPFFRQLIKINQYDYNCTSSMYSVPVQKKLYYNNCSHFLYMIQTRQIGKEPYQVVNNNRAHSCYEVSTGLLLKRGWLIRDRLHQSPKDFGGIDEEEKEVIHQIIESTADVEEDADDNDERARMEKKN